ncbi:adenylate/guanylate cyclase domain-containing protein [Acidovorax sp.]|jgi:adenylate cyclase|uniref:adenylate/guanylate cyclase domain-containing protein n=1 Tax=Acidovorax sp. TaxID=1872122 RepID=UPI0025BF36BD|nr:adenylate/guanylate cyclase domain-containing protein [Acidovorax sp.]MCI5071056.1 adenylate/guanylate cyclase domain-containing protein [Acidovorax sp.]
MSVLSTMVFADISGSTSLYEALGNERAAQAVTQVTQWIGDTIEGHGGRLVKKLGDGVLGVFGDAASAVSAMANLQRQHQARQNRWPHPLHMDIRVGVASGDVVEVEGDCYGDAVNVASRLCERAGPAEIWVTETAVLLAGESVDVRYRKLGMMEIRGKAELLTLYQVEWREDEAPDSLTTQAALASSFTPVDSILGQIEFSWHGVNHTFTSSDAPVQVGRSEHAQLCVNDPRVSRLHARIDWRNSGFVLTDMSSFGTWVRFDGSASPVRLRRDACILHGTGQIALGVSFTEPSAPVVSFQVTGTSMHLR